MLDLFHVTIERAVMLPFHLCPSGSKKQINLLFYFREPSNVLTSNASKVFEQLATCRLLRFLSSLLLRLTSKSYQRWIRPLPRLLSQSSTKPALVFLTPHQSS